jgi:hypothetical protein
VSVFLAHHLGAVADQEAGIAGELVATLGDHLDDKLFGDELATGSETVENVGLVEFLNNRLGIGAFADWRASRELSWDSLTSVRSSS